MASLIPYEKIKEEGLERCARHWGRHLGQSEGAKTFDGVGINDRRWQYLRDLDDKFVGLERNFEKEKKEGRGRCPRGLYRRGCLGGGGRVRGERIGRLGATP
jgi:hypothetical protein